MAALRSDGKRIHGATATSITEKIQHEDQLCDLLRSSERVVVISGAGISVNAGIPDFRSLKRHHKTSFESTIYQSTEGIRRFHDTTVAIFNHKSSPATKPSMFHQYMDQLAQEGRLLRHCTQNIDCLEYLLPSLEKNTVRLHGQVDEARCPKCNWKCTIDPHEFQRGPVICGGLCRDRSVARENQGRRPLGMGQLRPNIVLSGDDHPEEEEIIAMAHETLRMRPDLVLVVGTRLKIPGCRRLAEELCSDVLSRGGATVWINNSQMVPPYDFSYKFEGDCDAFAAMVS